MNHLYLLARIAGERVALAADLVLSVVEIGEITPVPLAQRHILGLAALRSRTLTMIDSQLALGVATSAPGGGAAVVVKIDEHLYGLSVDRIDDIVSIAEPPRPIRARLDAGWARAARGLIDHAGEGIVLLDPSALVAGPLGIAA